MVLIFDIGKTNKKCLVFDRNYQVVFEKSVQLPETTDEDGDPCEDLFLLTQWVKETFQEVMENDALDIKAVNCTAYGASFVHLDAEDRPVTPLYNYLKPYPEQLLSQFFETFGGQQKIALETASPVLGSLNSGLQLYRLKYEQPAVFQRIKWSLHLPQYIAFLLSGEKNSEITSLGCHTMLWDFRKNDYHEWVYRAAAAVPLISDQRITSWLTPAVAPADVPAVVPTVAPTVASADRRSAVRGGGGLHDSSAALIPYLLCFNTASSVDQRPTVLFLLLSTGTWCISLNPFNDAPLTAEELAQDCLCYLTYEGKPVKAARYFGGNEHEKAVRTIAEKHNVAQDFYKKTGLAPTSAAESDYLDFMQQLIEKQVVSTKLAIGDSAVKRIFVDGGFSKNKIYMHLLAAAFPEMEVFAAEVAQATALGAALAVHHTWNPGPIPENLIILKKYNHTSV